MAQKTAQIVIAAGPVITEPSNGPSVKIANHQEAGVAPPIAETLVIAVSVKRMIGSEPAIAMITTTKIASETFSDEKSGEISRPGMYELSRQKMMVATRFKGSFSIRPAAFRKGTESLDHGNHRVTTENLRQHPQTGDSRLQR
jgi:hypothetical protein